MQPLASLADQGGQPPLDVEMDVFIVKRPLEAAGLDLAAHLREAALDRREVAAADNAARREHSRMGKRALQVDEREPPVERDRSGEALDRRGYRLPETARPQLVF